MATVTFDKATRVYPGTERPAVDALNLHIEDGEFLVLVGPSGCGKSTSLRMLAGLEDVNAGRILIGDRDVTDVQPKDRDIAMVFQNYALYPHMTVADNMGFALKIAGTPKAEIRQRVEEAAKILDLSQYLDRKPKALSGGQRQRVAMGRAIVRSAPGVPHGRAAVEPRRQAPRPDPYADRVAAASSRRHHGLRHARPDRGPHHGRPHRGPQGRPPAAGRHAARHVRHPGQRLRRRLHRLAGHEHRHLPGARRRGQPRPLPRRRAALGHRRSSPTTTGTTSRSASAPSRSTSCPRARRTASRSSSTSSRSSAPTRSSTARSPTSSAVPAPCTPVPATPRSSCASTRARCPARARPSTSSIREGETHLFHAGSGERIAV